MMYAVLLASLISLAAGSSGAGSGAGAGPGFGASFGGGGGRGGGAPNSNGYVPRPMPPMDADGDRYWWQKMKPFSNPKAFASGQQNHFSGGSSQTFSSGQQSHFNGGGGSRVCGPGQDCVAVSRCQNGQYNPAYEQPSIDLRTKLKSSCGPADQYVCCRATQSGNLVNQINNNQKVPPQQQTFQEYSPPGKQSSPHLQTPGRPPHQQHAFPNQQPHSTAQVSSSGQQHPVCQPPYQCVPASLCNSGYYILQGVDQSTYSSGQPCGPAHQFTCCLPSPNQPTSQPSSSIPAVGSPHSSASFSTSTCTVGQECVPENVCVGGFFHPSDYPGQSSFQSTESVCSVGKVCCTRRTTQQSFPAQQPQQPRPAPQQPRPAPQQPRPAPQQPRPAPQQPRPAPQQPRPAPQPPRPAPQGPPPFTQQQTLPAPEQAYGPPQAPQQPRPAPQQPRPAPQQPRPAPQQPRPAPQQPRPVPQQPRPAPPPFTQQQPLPAPEQAYGAPQTPQQPRPAPQQPIPVPQQPRPAPQQPRPAPQPRPVPQQPRPVPQQPRPVPQQPRPVPPFTQQESLPAPDQAYGPPKRPQDPLPAPQNTISNPEKPNTITQQFQNPSAQVPVFGTGNQDTVSCTPPKLDCVSVQRCHNGLYNPEYKGDPTIDMTVKDSRACGPIGLFTCCEADPWPADSILTNQVQQDFNIPQQPAQQPNQQPYIPSGQAGQTFTSHQNQPSFPSQPNRPTFQQQPNQQPYIPTGQAGQTSHQNQPSFPSQPNRPTFQSQQQPNQQPYIPTGQAGQTFTNQQNQQSFNQGRPFSQNQPTVLGPNGQPLPPLRPLPPPQPYTGPLAEDTPVEQCAAALICVYQNQCNSTGYIKGEPQPEDDLVTYRVQLTPCINNAEGGFIGVCCRDPDYTDPWPQCLELQPGTQKYIMMGCAGKRRKRSAQGEEQPSKLDDLISGVLQGEEPELPKPKSAAEGGFPEVVEERRSYVPPSNYYEGECGIEYDCVPWYLCPNGWIERGGAGILDLRKQEANGTDADAAPQVSERHGGGYFGGFSTIPDKKCTQSTGENGVCCHKPVATSCPSEMRCHDGWHCPRHDGSQFADIRLHPRACVSGGNSQYAVCCEPRKMFNPVPKTCGVRNPDGLQPTIPLDPYANYQIDKRILDPAAYIDADTEAKFGEFPWQALVFKKTPQGYQFLSGGVLITTRHILTAAHYVHELTAYDLQVRLGEWEVNSINEPLEHQDYFVEQIFIHPHYKSGPEYNDLAVLLLNADVYITNNVHTVCLPDNEYQDFYEHRCIATGWGKNAFDGHYSQILKKVDLPIVPHDVCESALQRTRLSRYFELHKNFLCAGGEPGKDTCTGDGGGPLMCPVEGRYVLAGISSWGIGCGQENVPGVYASLAPALPWINTVLDYNPHRIFPPYIKGYAGDPLSAKSGLETDAQGAPADSEVPENVEKTVPE